MRTKLLSFRLFATVISVFVFAMLPVQYLLADSTTPLCFTAQSRGATVKFNTSGMNVTFQTSRTNNGTDWVTYYSNSTITLTNVGDKVYFRAATQHNKSFSRENASRFDVSGNVAASGNIMSLYGPDCPNIALPRGAFKNMFWYCIYLTSAPELPATNLSDSCYYQMFYLCRSLTTAPALPATTLADQCYYRMFYGCSSLATAPSLPATTLADQCYIGMFGGCSSLTAAPALPATTLAGYCYCCMFYGCTSLATAPSLPATTLADYCYSNMFNGCTSLATAPSLPATTLADQCYIGMFGGCSSLTAAPALPATTLAGYCYCQMFSGCSSLTTAPSLPATTLADWCYCQMFSGCSSLTTAPSLPATTLADWCYYQMFSGCSSLTTAPSLPATTLADGCYSYMFVNCTSLIVNTVMPGTEWTIPANANTSTVQNWNANMFSGTGGTFKSAPVKGQTYYIASDPNRPKYINAYTNTPNGGTVTGGGNYLYGDTALLVASPNTHYHLERWSNGKTSQVIKVPAYGDSTLIATFAIDRFTITATPNDASLGSVSGGGDYDYGQIVTLTATPKPFCHFVGWSNGETSPTITLTANSNVTLTANFAGNLYTISTGSNDDLMGNVTGGGVYSFGTTATLTATPYPHYHFVRWSNGETTPTITMTVTGDLTVTATFAADNYIVTGEANDASMGTVSGSGIYSYGQTATLTAVASDHHHFINWSSGSGTTTISFIVVSDTLLTANFAINQYTISTGCNDNSMGNVTGGGVYSFGATVTLTATPNAHYHFVKWSNGATTPTITITVTADMTLTATFAGDDCNVAGVANYANMGVVTGSGTYSYGQTATLTAIASDHHHFVNWSNGCNTAMLSFTVVGDTLLTANFAADQYFVTAYANDANKGYVTGGGYYNYGTTATLIAVPYEHYRFAYWSNGMTTPTVSLSVTHDESLTAFFEPEVYNITALANYSDRGNVTGSGQYTYGTTAMLIATPNEGFRFDHWSNGSTSQVIYVVAECDSLLIASFESTSTAVEDVEDNSDVIIAPNPVRAGETILINGDFDSEETDGMIVEIVKTDGTIVSRNYISMSPIEISGIYAAGTYIVRITTGTGKVYTTKLIVE